jgi:hypothetical protein
MLWTLEDNSNLNTFEYSDNGFLTKIMEGMVQGINELYKENANFLNYQKNMSKIEASKLQFINKRKSENEIRKSKNQSLLPESIEDLSAENPKLFKKPPEPDRFGSLVIDYQINYYCDQVLKHLR